MSAAQLDLLDVAHGWQVSPGVGVDVPFRRKGFGALAERHRAWTVPARQRGRMWHRLGAVVALAADGRVVAGGASWSSEVEDRTDEWADRVPYCSSDASVSVVWGSAAILLAMESSWPHRGALTAHATQAEALAHLAASMVAEGAPTLPPGWDQL